LTAVLRIPYKGELVDFPTKIGWGGAVHSAAGANPEKATSYQLNNSYRLDRVQPEKFTGITFCMVVTFMYPSWGDEMRIEEYLTEEGKSPFESWFLKLNARAAAKVTTALARLETGNTSNVKALGSGINEYKIDFGPG
jgi:hypothetical protein